MFIFNAFQLVLLFSCAPFIIQWLHTDATFYGHQVLFWTMIVAYVIGFGAMIASVAHSLWECR